MINLERDLDKFLRTDGLRILIESGAVVKRPGKPLTIIDPDTDQEDDEEE